MNKCWKRSKMLEGKLVYCLQFVTSNTPTLIIFPLQLTIILTHTNSNHEINLLSEQIKLVTMHGHSSKALWTFSKVHAIDVQSSRGVKFGLAFVFENFQLMLKRMPKVVAKCEIVCNVIVN